MSIGETLKQLRKERGLTQVEVANALHVNRSTYTKYETGTNAPSAEQIKAISEILGVTTNDILNPEPQEKLEPITPFKPAVRSDEEKLLGVYNSLDDRAKTQLMSVAYLMMADDLAKKGVDVNQLVEQQLHKIQDEGGEHDD